MANLVKNPRMCEPGRRKIDTAIFACGEHSMAYGLRARKLPAGFWAGAGKTGRTKKTSAVKKAVKRVKKSEFAKKVLAVVKKQEETKYVSQQLQQTVAMGQALITPAGLFNCLTPVTQGTGDHQRIGEKISPVKAAVDFTFQWTNDQSNNQDVIVNLWVVKAKGADSRVALPSVPIGQFLQVGNGTNRDPDDANQSLMLSQVQHMPLNRDQWAQCKHYRFRMRRGTGAQANQGPATIVAPTGVTAKEDFRIIRYTWKPPQLKYNTAADAFPTSHYPVYGYYVTNADGSAYGDTLHISTRTHLWFKDA